MSPYPEVVAKIVNDYLERLRSQLRLVPAREREEFLLEIQSHLYESYQQMPGDDDVARILAVLRNLGEPADVVSDRLPVAMVRAGTKRNLPLYILSGILIALFGIPLGFGGVGVVVGLLGALAGLVAAYYAVAGSALLVGGVFALVGATRILFPALWDKFAFIQFNGPPPEFLDHLSASDQGFLMLLFASLFLACGWGMLMLGKYLLRGLRFLVGMTFDRVRQFAQSVRRKLRQEKREGRPIEVPSWSS
jgi:uncharacterized membrane protein